MFAILESCYSKCDVIEFLRKSRFNLFGNLFTKSPMNLDGVAVVATPIFEDNISYVYYNIVFICESPNQIQFFI